MKPVLFTPPAQVTSFTRPRLNHQSSTDRQTSHPPARITPNCATGRKPWPAARFLRDFIFYTPLGNLLRKQSDTAVLPNSAISTARDMPQGPILVTGASGGAGRRIVRVLLSRNRRVRALTRSRPRLQKALQEVGVDMRDAETAGNLEVIVSDLYSIPQEAFFNISAVVSATGTKTGPQDDDINRSKYYQGIIQYPATILEDTPKNVEYTGISRLVSLAEQEFAMAEGTQCAPSLFDFSSENDTKAVWGMVDDVVMGGVSESKLVTKKGFLVFTGNVSTENSGGFASLRTNNFSSPIDVSNYTGLQIRFKGDGQRYKFIVRCDGKYNGVAYSFGFDTKAGEWSVVNAPFTSFRAIRLGRSVEGAPPLDPSHITAVQIMLSKFEQDGLLNPSFRAGTFELAVASINPFVYSSGKKTPSFVHVSSAAVTRPQRLDELRDTDAYVPIVQLNPTIGFLLDWKLAGEDAIRTSSLPYTIVRSTALTLEKAVGVERLGFEQGDLLSGRVTRDDLADLVVDVLDVSNLVGVTFEVATVGEGAAVPGGETVEKKAAGLLKDGAVRRSFGPFPYVPVDKAMETQAN